MRGGAIVDIQSGQLLSKVPFLFKLRPNKYNFALRLANTQISMGILPVISASEPRHEETNILVSDLV